MSYRGLDYGSGIQRFGDLLAQGDKDRRELEFQRQKYNSEIAERDIQNQLKIQQAAYDYPTELAMPFNLGNQITHPASVLDSYNAGVNAGNAQPTPHVGVIIPATAPGGSPRYEQLTNYSPSPQRSAPGGSPSVPLKYADPRGPNMFAEADPYAGFSGNRGPARAMSSDYSQAAPGRGAPVNSSSAFSQEAPVPQAPPEMIAAPAPAYVPKGNVVTANLKGAGKKPLIRREEMAAQGVPQSIARNPSNDIDQDGPLYRDDVNAPADYGVQKERYDQEKQLSDLAAGLGLRLSPDGKTMVGHPQQIKLYMQMAQHIMGSEAQAFVAGASKQAPIVKEQPQYQPPRPAAKGRGKAAAQPKDLRLPALNAQRESIKAALAAEAKKVDPRMGALLDPEGHAKALANMSRYQQQLDDLNVQLGNLAAGRPLDGAQAPQAPLQTSKTPAPAPMVAPQLPSAQTPPGASILKGLPYNGKIVTQVGHNKKTNQTQVIYADGSKEILNGIR